jgi:Tfp pilus assembly protein PilV
MSRASDSVVARAGMGWAVRAGRWMRGAGRGARRTRLPEGGFGLIEALVAVLVLSIVVLPSTLLVVGTERATAQQHLETEAVELASQALERLQAQAAGGEYPNGTTSSYVAVVENGSRRTDFTVRTTFAVVNQGTNETICAQGSSIATQIWLVTATVTWPGMHGVRPVREVTEIAPGSAGAIQQFAAEVAVPLVNLDLSPFAEGVNVSISGSWTGGGTPPPVPTGEVTSEGPVNSGSSGCAVFANLDAEAGWRYTVSLAGNPGLVSASENADSNPSGPLQVVLPPLAAGAPTVVNPPLVVGTGIGAELSFVDAADPAAPPAADLPVTFYSTSLTTSNGRYVVYDPSAQVRTTLLFPYPSYEAWSGDMPESNPQAQGPHGALYGPNPPAPVPVDTSQSQVSLSLPVYPLVLSLSSSLSATPTVTATDVDGSAAIDLNGFTGSSAGATSATGLPLGQYELSSPLGAVAPRFVWVTPSEVCTAATTMSVPSDGSCQAGTQPVAVTVS